MKSTRCHRVPNPPDLAKLRSRFERLSDARVRQALPKDAVKRRDFCFACAQKLKDAGLYAQATYLRDVAWSLVKRFHELSSVRPANLTQSRQFWADWRKANYVDLALWNIRRWRADAV